MTVLQVCAYGAAYAGNFISSLEALEFELAKKGIRTIYAFVGRAGEQEWCKKIEQRTKVYYLPEAKARILPKTYKIFRQIYRENDVSIVHSHFELYDIPCTVTAKSETAVFWHLHDPIHLGKQSRSRRILTKFQYGVIGKKAQLLSVAEEYRKMVVSLGFPEKQTTTIVNGLDLKRVSPVNVQREPEYDFLTFGWDFHRKGGDLILEACRLLAEDGYRFGLLFNGNVHTWPKLKEHLKGEEPAWLVLGDPVENINELFEATRVFIQASRRETFSYAVCEAAYAGLPVISTDIAGLEWAHDLPTVDFVSGEDVCALYGAMKRYLDGKGFSEEQYNRSRTIIEEKYSTQEWTRKILEQYSLR
jgi:glycosyltransferase involved in cell wall biosynthesis